MTRATFPGPDDLQEALLAWTATDEAKHPRWPAGTPGGLGGKFMPGPQALMRVGQRFLFDGKEWEIAHILDGKVYAHEASGKVAETREFDPSQTPGDPTELTGAVRPNAKAVVGGQGKDSTVTVVNPSVDTASHDPSIPVPQGADLTPEQWQRFGRLEQLHFTDLQQRYGKHKASATASLIAAAYKQYDAEIQDYVHNGYANQYGSSSGWSLSLTSAFKSPLSGKALEEARSKREAAVELQGLIRDAYAWDLYNRTKSPDVVMVHKDKDNQSPESYWKQKFIDGKDRVFSGLSWSHHFRTKFWSQTVGLMGAVSVRHVVMAVDVSGAMKGAANSDVFDDNEKEIAVPYQLNLDDSFISFRQKDVPAGYMAWLEGVTEHVTGGATFEKFREALEGKGTLPTPPEKPNLQMEGSKKYLPPPPDAAEAMAEYHTQLPAVAHSDIPREELAALGLPFDNLDDAGLPQALDAEDSGAKVGDFLMGKKGTLYWLGPDPGGAGNGRLHKLIPDGKGGLRFNDENFSYQPGYANYKLKGSVAPQTLVTEKFDEAAWAIGEKANPVLQMEIGDKFKVDGVPYQVTETPGSGITKIKDLDSGLTGTINSLYATAKLVPNEGYEQHIGVKPAKGMTLAYDGKKHTITSIKKDGTISAKPPGGKVIQIGPDDPALADKFDPSAWTFGEPIPASSLTQGDVFHLGTGKTIRPYKVTSVEGKKVNWKNLDTGKTGIFLGHKKVKALEPAAGGTGHADKPVNAEPVALAPEPLTQAQGEGEAPLPESMLGPFPSNEKAYKAALDTLGDAGQFFDGYKSSHGPGGKYKHEKIQDLPKGTVFQDKAGKKWMVQHQATTAIVTDGTQSYQINGGLRGKVINDAEAKVAMDQIANPVLVQKAQTATVVPEVPEPAGEMDVLKFLEPESASPDPPAGSFDTSFQSLAGKMKDNNEETPLIELPEGSYFAAFSGAIFQVEGMNSDLTIATKKVYDEDGTPASGAWDLDSDYVATAYIPRAAGEAGPPTPIATPPPAETKPNGKWTLAAFAPGDVFPATDGTSMKVVAHGDGGTVLKNLKTGGVSVQPPSTPMDAVAPGDSAVTAGALEPGNKFVDAEGKVNEVVAQSDYVGAIVKDPDGAIQTVKASTAVEPLPTEGATLLSMDLQAGDTFEGADGGQLAVVAVTAGEKYILKDGEGTKIKSFAPDATLEEIQMGMDKPAEVPVPNAPNVPSYESLVADGSPNDKPISELPIGTYAMTSGTGGSVDQIVAHGQSEVTLKGIYGPGGLKTPPDEFPGWNSWVPETVVLAKAEKGTAQPIQLQGYKSAWGSGGKYKHEKLNELTIGAKFKDKTGTVFELVEADAVLATFKNPTTGAVHKAPSDIRVRKI